MGKKYAPWRKKSECQVFFIKKSWGYFIETVEMK